MQAYSRGRSKLPVSDEHIPNLVGVVFNEVRGHGFKADIPTVGREVRQGASTVTWQAGTRDADYLCLTTAVCAAAANEGRIGPVFLPMLSSLLSEIV